MIRPNSAIIQGIAQTAWKRKWNFDPEMEKVIP